MPWTETCHGRFQRAIGENESFIKLVGDPGHALGREHWAINSIASFTLLGSLRKEDLPALFFSAWKHLRFEHPSIAAYVFDGKILEYDVPNSAELDQWATETFQVIHDKTADDAIAAIKPNQYATLTFLSKSNEILGHTAHWRTDGVGVLLLLDAFLSIAAKPDLSNPNELVWAPAVEEAASTPETPTEEIKALAQRYTATFYQVAGAIGVPYKGDSRTTPGGTRSARLLFTASETQRITSQCKAKGLSVTAAVHASVAATNAALALTENKAKHYTSTVRFSLRPYLPKPYSTPQYASGLYTTGWMKSVSEPSSWTENARAYNDEYRKGLSEEYIESHREYASGICNLLRNMPQGGDPPSDVDISSIGVAESLMGRTKGTSNRGFDVQSVSVGVEILSRQCVCFVWTFREQLNLNLVYNEEFHDETDTTKFLQTLKDILSKQLE